MIRKQFRYNGNEFEVGFDNHDEENVSVEINDERWQAAVHKIGNHTLSIVHDERVFSAYVTSDDTKVYVHVNGETYIFDRVEKEDSGFRRGMESDHDGGTEITAPMPGKILKVFVEEGQKVKKNAPLFIVEAMKMENEVKSPRAGTIQKINFGENDLVTVGQPVIELET